MPSTSRVFVAALLSLLLASTAVAGNLYRYQDKEGNPVISHTLPQAASQRGYDILNSNGRVVETVPPALTEEQKAAREAREKAEAEAAERAARQRERDRQLLRSYSHPDDVVRALRRKLEEMQSLIRLKQGEITSARAQIRQEQDRAADIERTGRDIPEHILTKIESLRLGIRETQAEIDRQKSTISELTDEYKAKAARLEHLTETDRTEEFPDAGQLQDLQS